MIKEKLVKYTSIGLMTLSLFGAGALVNSVHAEGTGTGKVDLWSDPYSDAEIGYNAFSEIGMGKRDPRRIIAAAINTLLGFLGVIAIILIMVGGFKWMTAQGNDAKVDAARKLMVSGVVGLLIVLASFAVSIYVTRVLLGITSAQPQNTYENVD